MVNKMAYGIDFNTKRTQIKAMLDGTATMVEKDLFYTGGTLIFRPRTWDIYIIYAHAKNLCEKRTKCKTR